MDKVIWIVIGYLWIAFFMYYIAQFSNLFWYFIWFFDFPFDFINNNLFPVYSFTRYSFWLIWIWLLVKLYRMFFISW